MITTICLTINTNITIYIYIYIYRLTDVSYHIISTLIIRRPRGARGAREIGYSSKDYDNDNNKNINNNNAKIVINDNNNNNNNVHHDCKMIQSIILTFLGHYVFAGYSSKRGAVGGGCSGWG